MKVALAHGNHALGKRCHHGAHDFRQGFLKRLHQHATPDLCQGGDLGGDLEPVVRKVNVVWRLTLPDGQDHIDGFCKHLVAVLVQDAQRFGIRGQCTRADAEDETPLGQVVEHGRLRRQKRGMRVRQIGSAAAQLDGFGFRDQGGQKQQAVGHVFGLVGQMLAHKRIVKTELVGQDDGLPIFVQSFGGVPFKGMQGHGEVA